MYFVRYHPQVVFQAYVSHAPKFVLCPYPSRWIVGVAKYAKHSFRVLGLCLEVVKIHLVHSVVVFQVRCDKCHIVVVRGMLEKGIRRSENKHLFVWLAKMPDKFVESRNNSGRSDQMLFWKSPAVHFFSPFRKDLVIILVKYLGVAKNTPVQPFLDRIDYNLWRGKFHVGNPHAYELVVGIWKLHCLRGVEYIVPKSVRVHCVCASAVDDFIKIVSHYAPPSFFN